MTAYNAMYRCSGGQKEPARIRGWKGECSACGRWFMRYPNGTVVVHKSVSEAVAKHNAEMRAHR